MAQLLLKELDPKLLGKLEERAKRLGLDLATAATRLLEDALDGGDRSQHGRGVEHLSEDECLAYEDGLLVYTGDILDLDLDHRNDRDQRARHLFESAT